MDFTSTAVSPLDHEQDIKRLFVTHERPEFGLPRSSVGREPAGLPREQLAGRDQTTGPRVGEHVLDLARAERLVHHDGDRACGERTEERRGRALRHNLSAAFSGETDLPGAPEPSNDKEALRVNDFIAGLEPAYQEPACRMRLGARGPQTAAWRVWRGRDRSAHRKRRCPSEAIAAASDR